jgi:hypothetical protein
MKQITTRRFSWASILEEGTREQAMTTATMPFIYPHLALMPDAHLGWERPSVRSSRPWGRSCPLPSASTSAAG